MEALQKKNACAIEHVLDERILTGIRMFMENRHTYSYMTRGNDLNLMFPEGKRIMPIAFFEKRNITSKNSFERISAV